MASSSTAPIQPISITCSCATPDCGLREACGGSGTVCYGCPECIRAHWREHMADCRRLQAEMGAEQQQGAATAPAHTSTGSLVCTCFGVCSIGCCCFNSVSLLASCDAAGASMTEEEQQLPSRWYRSGGDIGVALPQCCCRTAVPG